MLTQELEHLQIILDKKPIIGTWLAQDLIDRPEMVRSNYLEHVRSFVVLGRVGASADDQPTIEDYEKRLIRMVKDAEAAKGMISAEYGYGKTSTALFMWHRCEESDIVAVPPFQIQQLHHLISATYGWVRYKLSVSYPALVDEAEAIYQRYINRDIEKHGKNEIERATLRRVYQEGRYSLELHALDYVRYFEEMTALVQKAHFKGLVIIADELQQYIDPDIKSGVKDPLTPLFDIIQALITRKGQLKFALLFSVPTKELGLMNDQRGDLVQRLKSDRLALDLGTLYNQRFAQDLWRQLARELKFESLQEKIVQTQTLEALGQISARPDLANGPRTVVNAFNLMVQRYMSKPNGAQPFTPLDLVDAFLNNEISFDNTARLQQVVNGYLAHQFVQGRPDYQKAIKLMAAFPIDGLPESYSKLYGVQSAIEALTREAQGDIITFRGGGTDENGQPVDVRAMLVGLELGEGPKDWLTATLREFTRNYTERSPRNKQLIISGFQQLLRQEIFKGGSWKLERSLEASMSQNRAQIFEGGFNTTAKRYPNRRLYVRLVAPDEEVRDSRFDGDLAITFQLMLNYDLIDQERRHLPGQLDYPQDKTVAFQLNLSHNSGKESYGDLNRLDQLVAPWKITPALLLSLYAYLDEKRAANAIPKTEDEFIRSNFQPVLLEHALKELFNPELGAPFHAAQARIVEEAVRRELEKHYKDYKTFINGSQWRQNLREYHTALAGLPTPFERQGQQIYEKTSQELARLFSRTPPAMETFISNHSNLLQKVPNGFRFSLHPLENQLSNLIKNSVLPPKPPIKAGDKPRHYVKRDVALMVATTLGYREEEFEEAVHLLETRGLITLAANRTELIEEFARVLSIQELQAAADTYATRLKLVKEVLPDNLHLTKGSSDLEVVHRLLKLLVTQPDESKQNSVANTLKARQTDIGLVIEGERTRIAQDLTKRVQQELESKLNTRVLDAPLNPGLFSSQLESQRVGLVKACTEVSEGFAPLKERLADLIGVAGQLPLPDEDLAALVQGHKQLIQQIFQQRERQVRLNEMLNHYEQARSLLNQSQSFEQRLATVPSILAEEFAPRLKAWALEVTSTLSSQKLQGLAQQSTWRANFETISLELEKKLEEETKSFAEKQQDYRNYLRQQFPSVSSWNEIVYNPTEPQDSYNRLWDAVHNVFKQAVEQIRREVQEVCDRAARLQGGLSQLPKDKRKEAQTRLTAQAPQLNEDQSKITAWAAQVNDQNFMKPVRDSGATTPAEKMLKPVVTRIGKITEKLPQSKAVVLDLEKLLEILKLKPDEESALTVLRKLAKDGSSEGIELGLLLQQLGSSPDNTSESWKLIESLYNKLQLRIQVAPVSSDEAK